MHALSLRLVQALHRRIADECRYGIRWGGLVAGWGPFDLMRLMFRGSPVGGVAGSTTETKTTSTTNPQTNTCYCCMCYLVLMCFIKIYDVHDSYMEKKDITWWRGGYFPLRFP